MTVKKTLRKSSEKTKVETKARKQAPVPTKSRNSPKKPAGLPQEPNCGEIATLKLPCDFGISGCVLVTGAAGFIGFHLTLHLIKLGVRVIGFDSVNDYYDPSLKHSRLAVLEKTAKQHCPKNPKDAFTFVKGNLANMTELQDIFLKFAPPIVVHLAAQAGVRYSLTNPGAYIESNLVGFANILECCKHYQVKHLLYASSSSVYGGNVATPFSEQDNVDHPVSLYAATKKSNELMAHSYAHLFKIPCTGLRFFTVYGPYGRPDMATAIFTKKILAGQPIDLFNFGKMKRDFTFVDDIVEGIVKLLERPPKASPPEWDPMKPDPSISFAPARVFNIGNSDPVELLTFVELLEKALHKKAKRKMMPMQPGDVLVTSADTRALAKATGFAPSTPLSEGLKKFAAWYRSYYKV